MYVIAVHNVGRAILLWGTSKEEKNLKSYVLDDSFPERVGRGVENFPFFYHNWEPKSGCTS